MHERMPRRSRLAGAIVGLLLMAPSPGSAEDSEPVITTVVGSVGQGPAKSFGQHPWDLAYQPPGDLLGEDFPDGALYAADFTWNVVRRLNLATGQMTVVAGNGGWASTGDGGPALEAQIYLPSGIELDQSGNLYISTSTRIRRVDFETGIITSVAGRGTAVPLGSGPGFCPSGMEFDDAGRLYVAERCDQRVWKINAAFTSATVVAGTGQFGYSGDGEPATDARLAMPSDVEIDDGGNVYIADRVNNRVRMVDTNGIITTVAGTGDAGYSGDGGPATEAELSGPRSLAFGPDGSLFVADRNNFRIRRISADGTIHHVAGVPSSEFTRGDGGPAAAAFTSPEGIEFDEQGNLYIADTTFNGIRVIDQGGIIDTLSGNGFYGFSGDGGPATQAQIYWPEGSISFDAEGNLFIPDTIYSLIRKVDTERIITRVGGTGIRGYDGDNKPATEAKLYHPMDAVVAADGSIFVTDNFGHRIRKIDPSGTITTIAGDGTSGFRGDGGPATSARLSSPTGLALDEAGNLYVADTGNHRIRMIDTSGTITTIVGFGVGSPLVDGILATLPLSPLRSPHGISFDDEGNLYIADTGNNRIRMLDTEGDIHTVAGNGTAGDGGDGGSALDAELSMPKDVAVADDGTFYIADWYNNRVRAVGPDGVIRAFAGDGSFGFLGDGGPATRAHMYGPSGVAVGPDGSVYIVDQYNSRIRRVA